MVGPVRFELCSRAGPEGCPTLVDIVHVLWSICASLASCLAATRLESHCLRPDSRPRAEAIRLRDFLPAFSATHSTKCSAGSISPTPSTWVRKVDGAVACVSAPVQTLDCACTPEGRVAAAEAPHAGNVAPYARNVRPPRHQPAYTVRRCLFDFSPSNVGVCRHCIR